MEPTELPPLWALDMAAKAAGWRDYNHALTFHASNESLGKSIHAHARTLAKYETPPVDPAELKRWQDARELAVAVMGDHWNKVGKEATLAGDADCERVVEVYKWLCHRDGVEPQDKVPGGVA